MNPTQIPTNTLYCIRLVKQIFRISTNNNSRLIIIREFGISVCCNPCKLLIKILIRLMHADFSLQWGVV